MSTRKLKQSRNQHISETDLRSQREQMSNHHQALKLQFILTELDLASTFCEVAASTSDEERGNRNVMNARQAYESAAKFLRESKLEPKTMQEISLKMSRLREQLRDLGQLDMLEETRS